VVGGVGVAGLVFAVPEVEVGLVLVEDELIEGCVGDGSRCGDVVAMGVGLIVKREDVGSAQHGVVEQG
jgi:hypothetical protein